MKLTWIQPGNLHTTNLLISMFNRYRKSPRIGRTFFTPNPAENPVRPIHRYKHYGYDAESGSKPHITHVGKEPIGSKESVTDVRSSDLTRVDKNLRSITMDMRSSEPTRIDKNLRA